jgi:hypothetical protein
MTPGAVENSNRGRPHSIYDRDDMEASSALIGGLVGEVVRGRSVGK